MIVDFHVHSTASDGTLVPSKLVGLAYRGEFAALALTDHDNTDGISEFLSSKTSGTVSQAINLISGIELSIEPGVGFDKFHLLGLGIDPKNVELKFFLRQVLEGRNRRNRRIQANFHRIGINMPLDPRTTSPTRLSP